MEKRAANPLARREIEKLSAEQLQECIAEWKSKVKRLKNEEAGNVNTGRGAPVRGQRYHPYTFVTNTDTNQPPEPKISCSAFTSTGVCYNTKCNHDHNPAKTALCKTYLYSDNCRNGDGCSLSHTPSPHNTPHCQYFQSASCTKETCRFVHARIGRAAPICEAFARLGYCEKGIQCSARHAFECPDFANTGICGSKHCKLRHVRDAGRMRLSDHSPPHAPGNGQSVDPETPSVQEPGPRLVTNGIDRVATEETGGSGLFSREKELTKTVPSTTSLTDDFIPFES